MSRITVWPSGPQSSQGSRATQQDAASVHARGGFAYAVVCDGVGSSPTADVCARLTVEAATEHLAVLRARRRNTATFLHALPDAVHQQLTTAAAAGTLDPEAKTTLAAAVLDRGLCWAVTVGDSMILHVRDGCAIDATLPHSAAGAAAAHLTAPRGAADTSLTRWLSPSHPGESATVQSWRVRAGDAIVVASDGAFEGLPPWRVARLVTEAMQRDVDAADALISEIRTNAPGEADNATVVVLETRSGKAKP